MKKLQNSEIYSFICQTFLLDFGLLSPKCTKIAQNGQMMPNLLTLDFIKNLDFINFLLLTKDFIKSEVDCTRTCATPH